MEKDSSKFIVINAKRALELQSVLKSDLDKGYFKGFKNTLFVVKNILDKLLKISSNVINAETLNRYELATLIANDYIKMNISAEELFRDYYPSLNNKR